MELRLIRRLATLRLIMELLLIRLALLFTGFKRLADNKAFLRDKGLACLCLVGALLCPAPTHAKPLAPCLTPVRVQLKWLHSYQFAGFYAAQQQGYFKQAGLEVELIEGGPSIDPVDAVVNGKADFGIGNSSLLIDYFKGRPVLAVAAIFQHSPFVILAKRDPDIRSVQDLAGKTLMGETHAAELTAFLKLSGVELARINKVPHTGSLQNMLPSASNPVDATTAYISVEPFEATAIGLPYQLFNPRDNNIDFYGDTLFTSQAFAAQNPQLVSAMREALMQGWQYAKANSDQLVSLILERYPDRNSRAALTYEAQTTNDLLGMDMVDIGYMSHSRWQHIADVFRQTGLISGNLPLTNFWFDPKNQLPPWALHWLLCLGTIALIACALAYGLHRSNRKRQREIDRRTHLEQQLIQLAATDCLTGLANRRRLFELAEQELAKARRYGHPLSLLVLDLDFFKDINDVWGHAAGDQCLKAIAEACRSVFRECDIPARLGGDEFAILLPASNTEQAQAAAKRLLAAVAECELQTAGQALPRLSVSIGIAGLAGEDSTLDNLLERADLDMYRAKKLNRG